MLPSTVASYRRSNCTCIDDGHRWRNKDVTTAASGLLDTTSRRRLHHHRGYSSRGAFECRHRRSCHGDACRCPTDLHPTSNKSLRFSKFSRTAENSWKHVDQTIMMLSAGNLLLRWVMTWAVSLSVSCFVWDYRPTLIAYKLIFQAWIVLLIFKKTLSFINEKIDWCKENNDRYNLLQQLVDN